MTDSNRQAPPPPTDRATRSLTSSGPYSGPARATAARDTREAGVVASPYVPAPFRGKPVLRRADTDAERLPSINSFLSTPARGLTQESQAPEPPSVTASATGAEAQWPLDEAGAELQRIGDLFDTSESDQEPSGLFTGAFDKPIEESPTPAVGSKSLWRSDEWMDIMPVSPPERAEQHDSSNSDRNDTKRVAEMLESVAQRVRDGEIELASYHESMTDEALLAALLTAMLRTGR